TFALPNLMGRLPVHPGAGPGSTPRRLGESGRTAAVMLTEDQLPTHAHPLLADTGRGSATDPGPTLALSSPPGNTAYIMETPDKVMSPRAITPQEGGNMPHSNMVKFLALNFCIALTVVGPPRG